MDDDSFSGAVNRSQGEHAPVVSTKLGLHSDCYARRRALQVQGLQVGVRHSAMRAATTDHSGGVFSEPARGTGSMDDRPRRSEGCAVLCYGHD